MNIKNMQFEKKKSELRKTDKIIIGLLFICVLLFSLNLYSYFLIILKPDSISQKGVAAFNKIDLVENLNSDLEKVLVYVEQSNRSEIRESYVLTKEFVSFLRDDYYLKDETNQNRPSITILLQFPNENSLIFSLFNDSIKFIEFDFSFTFFFNSFKPFEVNVFDHQPDSSNWECDGGYTFNQLTGKVDAWIYLGIFTDLIQI